MTDLYTYLWTNAAAFSLVLVRVSTLFFFLPIFGVITPFPIKAGICLVLTLIFTPLVVGRVSMPTDIWNFFLLLVPEALLGMSMGLLVRIIFAGVQLGGQLLGFQMGFGVAEVIDPVTGAQAPVLSQMAYLITLLLFLVLNIHHYFLLALGEGFRLLPPGLLKLSPSFFLELARQGEILFRLSLRILAPVLAILLLLQIAFGIICRFVPQINIMIVSFPLTIGVGLFFFGLTLELLAKVLNPAFGRAVEQLPYVLKAFGGG